MVGRVLVGGVYCDLRSQLFLEEIYDKYNQASETLVLATLNLVDNFIDWWKLFDFDTG